MVIHHISFMNFSHSLIYLIDCSQIAHFIKHANLCIDASLQFQHVTHVLNKCFYLIHMLFAATIEQPFIPSTNFSIGIS